MTDATKKYYESNKEAIIKKNIIWNNNNKDKVKSYQKKYTRANASKINEYNTCINKNKYRYDDGFKIKCILLAKHKAFMQGESNGFDMLVGLTLKQYKAHIQSLLPEGHTFDNYGKKWQIRRTKSFKEYNLNNLNEQKKFMDYKNVYVFKINKDE